MQQFLKGVLPIFVFSVNFIVDYCPGSKKLKIGLTSVWEPQLEAKNPGAGTMSQGARKIGAGEVGFLEEAGAVKNIYREPDLLYLFT